MPASTESLTSNILEGTWLCVATPMYGNVCNGNYTESMMQLSTFCQTHDVRLSFSRIGNESLITRARNMCAFFFLQQETDFLFFIDADISFSAEEALRMLTLMKKNPQYDVLAGCYPKKAPNWDNVKKAVSLGVGSKRAQDLEHFVGDFAVNFIENKPLLNLDEPLEVAHAATGFMLIRRSVFQRFQEAYPNEYCLIGPKNDQRKMHLFFECGVDPQTQVYLSEDYMFCHKLRQIGIKIWICPWIVLDHEGSYCFKGGLRQHHMLGTPIKRK